MKELLNAILEHLDPNDPLHADARDRLTRCLELNERGEQLRAEAYRLFHAGDIEGAEAILSQHGAITEERRALLQRGAHVAAHLRPSTETMQ